MWSYMSLKCRGVLDRFIWLIGFDFAINFLGIWNKIIGKFSFHSPLALYVEIVLYKMHYECTVEDLTININIFDKQKRLLYKH